jgi:hypothetical protein
LELTQVYTCNQIKKIGLKTMLEGSQDKRFVLVGLNM